ncbi:hypothetical protein ACQKKX_00055 [Neorhizobium sp. NPDC001467]|uniref:hypothetical protein n=1 Tax=Neorhizobium sp. NPDC001467 TaxID=3390595 RepID=UPI003D0031C0
MQDQTGMQDRDAHRAGREPDIARSCGTGEAPHHGRDPITADLRRAKKQFEGDRPAGHVSHVVDAGDSGGYVSPYEIDMDDGDGDDPAGRQPGGPRDEAE